MLLIATRRENNCAFYPLLEIIARISVEFKILPGLTLQFSVLPRLLWIFLCRDFPSIDLRTASTSILHA